VSFGFCFNEVLRLGEIFLTADLKTDEYPVIMARKCDITGKGTRTGHNVSHSHRKTKRTFKANVHRKRIYLEDEKRWVSLNVSTRALRTIQKIGIRSLLKKHPEVRKISRAI